MLNYVVFGIAGELLAPLIVHTARFAIASIDCFRCSAVIIGLRLRHPFGPRDFVIAKLNPPFQARHYDAR